MKIQKVKTLHISEETIIRVVRSFLNEHNYNLSKKDATIDNEGIKFNTTVKVPFREVDFSTYNPEDSITENINIKIDLEELNQIMAFYYSEKEEDKVSAVDIKINYWESSASYNLYGTAILK